MIWSPFFAQNYPVGDFDMPHFLQKLSEQRGENGFDLGLFPTPAGGNWIADAE